MFEKLRNCGRAVSFSLKTRFSTWLLFFTRRSCHSSKFHYVCAQTFYFGNFTGNPPFHCSDHHLVDTDRTFRPQRFLQMFNQTLSFYAGLVEALPTALYKCDAKLYQRGCIYTFNAHLCSAYSRLNKYLLTPQRSLPRYLSTDLPPCMLYACATGNEAVWFQISS